MDMCSPLVIRHPLPFATRVHGVRTEPEEDGGRSEGVVAGEGNGAIGARERMLLNAIYCGLMWDLSDAASNKESNTTTDI